MSGIGPWGFVRATPDMAVVALYNIASEPREVTIEGFPFSAKNLVDIFSEEKFPDSQVGEAYPVMMAPASALLLISDE